MRTRNSIPTPWGAVVGALLCTCGSLLAGCASLPTRPDLAQITADEILAGGVLGLTEDRRTFLR